MKPQQKISTSALRTMIFPIILLVLMSGCAGPRIAEDLLIKVDVLDAPLVDNGYIISSEINPKINNYERIDNSVKESLVIALKKANIFSNILSVHPYTININVEVASQVVMSFGNFEGKLQVKYTVYDENKNKMLEKTIYTEAGSDEWFFSGAKRHSRARAVNIAKNVLEFTDYLKKEPLY
ncbi:hypothetical protein [Psychromonas sp.]|uniref:hypothetical protein n=1 Tax=Psychromonas sp. TaxID=1884585 RepID=UPI0035619CC1